jgi:uncharacterized coiled-coil protein SlyX
VVTIDNIVELLPLISILLASVTAFFTWYTRRDNDKADAASTLTGSALSLVQALEKRIDDLEHDLSAERMAREALQERTEDQDATIAGQGAIIMQLRETVDKQAGRIDMLEKENGRLQAENHRLKTGRGGKI